jgi:DNA-binding MarR family transcriptional regulator
MDIIKELGYLTLGTRLKRLGERLQSQAQVLLDEAGNDLQASYYPILAALDRLGALNVGDLAEAVGISQPGVTRMLDKLEAAGLVQSVQSADDRRVRSVELSKTGFRLVSKSKRAVWPMIEAAVADACDGQAKSLPTALSALEEALSVAPLSVRAGRLRSRVG